MEDISPPESLIDLCTPESTPVRNTETQVSILERCLTEAGVPQTDYGDTGFIITDNQSAYGEDSNNKAQNKEAETPEEDYNDMEQLGDVFVTVSVKTLRQVLKKQLPIWHTVMLLIASNITHVNAAPDMFRPVQPQENPLFGLTAEDTLIQIEKTNFSIVVQPYEQGPYIMSTEDKPAQAYHCITNVIDLKDLAIPSHNAKKFLKDHKAKKEYRDQMGFHSKFTTDMSTPMEYMMYPAKLSFEECDLTCPLLKASMPQGHEEIREANEVLGLHPEDSFMWVVTSQTATIPSNWDWDHLYDYVVKLDDIQIYPKSTRNPAEDSNNCTAMLEGKPIDHNQIGYIYQWYHRGEYNRHRPYKLNVAFNSYYECQVMVPSHDLSMNAILDDHKCICVRPKRDYYYKSNHLDAEQINQQLAQLLENITIEDWRYSTSSSSTSILDNLKPRYVKYSTDLVRSFENAYITNTDLTTLKISNEHTMTLKAGDVLTGIAKVALANPALMTDLHSKMKSMLTPHDGLKTIPTDSVIGNDEAFTTRMNKMNRDFNINRTDNIIHVTPKNNHPINWNHLNRSISQNAAQEGIREARKQVINLNHFKTNVLPVIMQQILIPRIDLIDADVAFEVDTLVSKRQYGSYIELQIYVPVLLKQNTRIHSIAPLPFKYLEIPNEYIIKQLPKHLSLTPGKPTSQPIDTPCAMSLIHMKDHVNQCQNERITYSEINELLTIGDLTIYLIKQIGMVSIACPKTKLRWFSFDNQINVMALHSSCFLESRGGHYNLQITPNTTTAPTGISSMIIMVYNIHRISDWTPSKVTNWYLILGLIITTGLLILSLVICAVALKISLKKVTMWSGKEQEISEASHTGMKILSKVFGKRKQPEATIPSNINKTSPKFNHVPLDESTSKDNHRNSYHSFKDIADAYPEAASTYFERSFAPELSEYYGTVRPNRMRNQAPASKGYPISDSTFKRHTKQGTVVSNKTAHSVADVHWSYNASDPLDTAPTLRQEKLTDTEL